MLTHCDDVTAYVRICYRVGSQCALCEHWLPSHLDLHSMGTLVSSVLFEHIPEELWDLTKSSPLFVAAKEGEEATGEEECLPSRLIIAFSCFVYSRLEVCSDTEGLR